MDQSADEIARIVSLNATAPARLARAVAPRFAQAGANGGDQAMLRIEKDSDGCVARFRLSGRIQADCIASIRATMNDGSTRKILDLREVTLVDISVVRFLISCEDEGVELVQSPPYVRECIVRERAEGAQPEPSHDN